MNGFFYGARYGWRIVLGKPDGWWPVLRCRLRGGHKFVTCWDACCDGLVNWCEWCLTTEPSLHGALDSGAECDSAERTE